MCTFKTVRGVQKINPTAVQNKTENLTLRPQNGEIPSANQRNEVSKKKKQQQSSDSA